MDESGLGRAGFVHLSRKAGETERVREGVGQRSMVPAMKSSTACRASLSVYCTGGDFMK